MYIHILHSIQPIHTQDAHAQHTSLCFGRVFKKDFFFPGKKLFASQAFLNSSGSLLFVFGWVKDSVYLAICKEPLLFLYFFCFLLRFRVKL
jgi:hypothetical protein